MAAWQEAHMRTLMIGLGLSAIVSCGNMAQAQSPGQQLYEKDEARAAVHQATPAERVHERAAEEARARLSRIEYRHALGISPQRPTMYAQPLHQNVLYVAPWGMYGACPVPYGVWVP
jgi:hypothetical protein